MIKDYFKKLFTRNKLVLCTNLILISIIWLLPCYSHGHDLVSPKISSSTKNVKLTKISAKSKDSPQSLQLSKIKKKYKYIYLRAVKVNLRAGPSTRYPINWTIHNKGEPLKFLTSFYQWIKVEDINGHQGWLQAPMISTRYMYGVVINKKHKPIIGYAMANSKSRKIVKLEPGVRVRVLKCLNTKWCKIRIDKFKAWVTLKNLWGVNSYRK